MRRSRRTPAAAALVAAIIAGDAQEGFGQTRSAAVDSVFSVRVNETDDLYIGQPSGLAVASTGEFYLGDGFASHVLRVDRRGAPVQVIGQKGRGPGEFIIPQPLLIDGSTFAASDNQVLRLQLFDVERGEIRAGHTYSGVLYSAATAEDGIWLGVNDRVRRSGVVLLRDGALSSPMLPWPNAYEESSRLAGIYDAVFVAAWADTVAAMYQGSDALTILTEDGSSSGSRSRLLVDGGQRPSGRRDGCRTHRRRLLTRVGALRAPPPTGRDARAGAL